MGLCVFIFRSCWHHSDIYACGCGEWCACVPVFVWKWHNDEIKASLSTAVVVSTCLSVVMALIYGESKAWFFFRDLITLAGYTLINYFKNLFLKKI